MSTSFINTYLSTIQYTAGGRNDLITFSFDDENKFRRDWFITYWNVFQNNPRINGHLPCVHLSFVHLFANLATKWFIFANYSSALRRTSAPTPQCSALDQRQFVGHLFVVHWKFTKRPGARSSPFRFSRKNPGYFIINNAFLLRDRDLRRRRAIIWRLIYTGKRHTINNEIFTIGFQNARLNLSMGSAVQPA